MSIAVFIDQKITMGGAASRLVVLVHTGAAGMKVRDTDTNAEALQINTDAIATSKKVERTMVSIQMIIYYCNFNACVRYLSSSSRKEFYVFQVNAPLSVTRHCKAVSRKRAEVERCNVNSKHTKHESFSFYSSTTRERNKP